MDGYPAGPYGVSEGTVLADLAFARPDGSTLRISDAWRDDSHRVMVLVTASGWCTSCIEEQPAYEAFHRKYAARGLYMALAIFEDPQFEPATAEYSASWKTRHSLSLEVVADTPFQLQQYYNRELTPMVMIVDMDTMEILRISTGWDEASVGAIVESRL